MGAIDEGPAHPASLFLAYHDCELCGNLEQRIWTDSWTGKALCQMCLTPVIGRITNSPASDGDNLNAMLKEEHG